MQPTISHQMMGYDRTSAMFSPDGRMLQVEYAKKAIKGGATSLGMVCKDGVVLLADRKVTDELMEMKSIQKIFQVDDHIGASATGYLMDGRVLIERAQLLAQQYRITYDSPIDVLNIVKEISNVKQVYTQLGGARPFGVSILFAGIDEDGPKLFMTDVTGMYYQYKATAIGEAETQIKDTLIKSYKEGVITVDQGIRLGLEALKKALGKDFGIEKIDGMYIKTDDMKFVRLDKEYFKKILKA